MYTDTTDPSFTVVAIIIGGIIAAIVTWRRNRNRNSTTSRPLFMYRRKTYIMTHAEQDFFFRLTKATEGRYYIFPQVHLSAIIDHKIKGQSWRGAFRHINGKSVDYVLCDKALLKPLLAIELDDYSHDGEVRRIRDEEVERIFNYAQLPLLRFREIASFSDSDISTLIQNKINGVTTDNSPIPERP